MGFTGRDGEDTYELPKFAKSISPEPNRGSRAWPSCEKSKLRLCSICYRYREKQGLEDAEAVNTDSPWEIIETMTDCVNLGGWRIASLNR